MASKRIDELTTRSVVNTDLLPPTPSGGPSGSATVAAVVAAGLSQPNSASAGAGASITIKAADGVTSGAGGSIILQPGAQATTGGNGGIKIRSSDGTVDSFIKVYEESANLWQLAIYPGQNANYSGTVIYRSSGGLTSVHSTFNYLGDLVLNTSGVFKWGDSGSTQLLRESIRAGRTNNTGTSLRSEQSGVMGLWTESAFTVGASFAVKSNTPSAIVASQNNYVLNQSAFQRLDCTTASDITGIAPPTGGAHVDGRMIRVFNVGSANLTFKHNSASSSAANRMYAASGADIVLGANDYIECVYDSTDNGSGAAGWRIA